MNIDSLIAVFLNHLGYNLPAMIVMIVGMAWTHSTWQRHPPAARWAMTALVWMFITYLITFLWHTVGDIVLLNLELPRSAQTPFLIVLSCFEAIGYTFFMLALNAARYPHRPPQYYDHYSEDENPPRTT